MPIKANNDFIRLGFNKVICHLIKHYLKQFRLVILLQRIKAKCALIIKQRTTVCYLNLYHYCLYTTVRVSVTICGEISWMKE